MEKSTTTKYLEVTMSNNKQSSVEQLEFDLKLWFDIMKIYFPTEIQNSINRSKAIHEEEIIDACGRFTSIFDGDINDFKEYYNETFGGNK